MFSEYIDARFLVDSGLTGSDLDYLRRLLPGVPESTFNDKEALKKLLNAKFPKEYAKLISLAPASNFWNTKDWLIAFFYKDMPKEELTPSLIKVGEELEKIDLEAQLENAAVEDKFGKKPFDQKEFDKQQLSKLKLKAAQRKAALGGSSLAKWAQAALIAASTLVVAWGLNSGSKSIARAAEAATPPLLIIGGTFLIGSIIWKYT